MCSSASYYCFQLQTPDSSLERKGSRVRKSPLLVHSLSIDKTLAQLPCSALRIHKKQTSCHQYHLFNILIATGTKLERFAFYTTISPSRWKNMKVCKDSAAFFKIAWSIIWDSIGVGKPVILTAMCEIFRSLDSKSRTLLSMSLYTVIEYPISSHVCAGSVRPAALAAGECVWVWQSSWVVPGSTEPTPPAARVLRRQTTARTRWPTAQTHPQTVC